MKKVRMQVKRIYMKYFNCVGFSCEYIRKYLLDYIFINKKGKNAGKTFVKSYIIAERPSIFFKKNTDIKRYVCLVEFDQKVDLYLEIDHGRGILHIEDCGAEVQKVSSFSEFVRIKERIIASCDHWIANDFSSIEKRELVQKEQSSNSPKLVSRLVSRITKFFCALFIIPFFLFFFLISFTSFYQIFHLFRR